MVSLGLSSYSTVELPFYSKYLLIAAYLASHNPAKTDRQLFCKTTLKKMTKRSKVTAKKNAKADNQLKGISLSCFPFLSFLPLFLASSTTYSIFIP